MARFDKDTASFFEKMAEGTPEEEKKPFQHIATIRRVVRAAENPERAIGKALVSGAVNAMLEKTSSTSVLGVFRLLNASYGTSWWGWEPETLWKTLEEDHSFKESEEAKNLIMALQVVVSNNAPFEDWYAFEKIGHAFCQNPVSFGILQPLNIDEAGVSMALLRLLRPKEEFDDEILSYVASRAKESGIVFLPKEIFGEKTQGFLERLGNPRELSQAVENLWKKGERKSQAPEIAYQLSVLFEIKDHLAELGGGK